MTVPQPSDARMRAAVLEAHGAPFHLAEIPRPVAGPGQVLVRVAASGVNPLDTKIHKGEAAHARHPLPAILGIDLAGRWRRWARASPASGPATRSSA